MTVRIGTSGWQYADWRGAFYPEKMPQRLWLERYASHFDVVEVNNTFYRLPAAEVFAQWRERVPASFRFALKLSRYISHIRRLREPAESMRTFLERAAQLGDRIGPLLLQLPPNFPVDPGRLEDALAAVPHRFRVAVEVRHASWFREEVAAVLRRHDAALCLTDRCGEPQEPRWPTAGWGYLRFHQGAEGDWSYGERTLRDWASRVRSLWGEGADVHAFFNNDPGCAAVRDAAAFAQVCAEAGLAVSRVPDAGALRSV
ncbi:MAG TPA: DUF72 domain-containing protein [Candidatus Binatia bacterium]|nr:DUF72 domain-containing protein [Candidatus Binatia bacterium]